MNVAQVCFSGAFGGLELSSVNWTRQFAANGHPSYLICRRHSELERSARAAVKTLPVEVNRKYFNPTASVQVRRLVDAHSIDILFLHQLTDLWIVAPALWRRPHVRCVAFARMFLANVSKKDLLHRALYRRLSHLIALTPSQLVGLLECLPIPEHKCVVIPNGVDTHRFTPGSGDSFRQGIGFPLDACVVGFVGRLDRQKGIGEFLDAAEGIVRERSEVYFLIVGDVTLGEGDGFAKRIADLEAASNSRIKWLPFSNDVVSCLRALDIFVMPSYAEAFGKVLIEAMACGVACIATRAGGVPDILHDGVSGVLIPPKSSSAIREAILRLANHEAKTTRVSLGQRARAIAVAEFDQDQVFKRVVEAVGLAETIAISSDS